MKQENKWTKKEVDNFIGCINFISNELLNKLNEIYDTNEQYFGECNILGVDRIGIFERFKALLENYKKTELNLVEKTTKGKIIK